MSRSKEAISITGIDEFIGKLSALEANLESRYAKKAVEAAGEVLVRSITPRVPQSSGTLANAMGVKSVTYRRGSGGVVAVTVVGARKDVSVTVGTKKRGKNKGKPIVRRPVKYDHLAEYGFVDRGGNFVAGHGYMRGGVAAAANRAMDAMADSLRRSLKRNGLT